MTFVIQLNDPLYIKTREYMMIMFDKQGNAPRAIQDRERKLKVAEERLNKARFDHKQLVCDMKAYTIRIHVLTEQIKKDKIVLQQKEQIEELQMDLRVQLQARKQLDSILKARIKDGFIIGFDTNRNPIVKAGCNPIPTELDIYKQIKNGRFFQGGGGNKDIEKPSESKIDELVKLADEYIKSLGGIEEEKKEVEKYNAIDDFDKWDKNEDKFTQAKLLIPGLTADKARELGIIDKDYITDAEVKASVVTN